MVKYITNVEFKDRYTWEIIPKGTELELTEERAEEIIKALGEEALTKVEEEPVEEDPVKKSGRGKNKETEEVE